MAQPFPFMQFYFADYDAHTPHLSTLEHGVYFLLIKAYWQSGRALPDDDQRLAIVAGLGLAKWKSVRAHIAPFFEIRRGAWRHHRIEEELEKARGRIEHARAAGVASGARRRGRESDAGAGPRSNAGSTPVRPGFEPKSNYTDSDSDSDSEIEEEESSSGPIAALVAAWDRLAQDQGLPIIRAMTEARRRSARARLREHGQANVLRAIALIAERPFLLGLGRRGWKADLDWLLRPASIPRILEGQRYLGCDEEDEKPSGWRP